MIARRARLSKRVGAIKLTKPLAELCEKAAGSRVARPHSRAEAAVILVLGLVLRAVAIRWLASAHRDGCCDLLHRRTP